MELGEIEAVGMAAALPLGAVGCVATLVHGQDLVLYVAPESVDAVVGLLCVLCASLCCCCCCCCCTFLLCYAVWSLSFVWFAVLCVRCRLVCA